MSASQVAMASASIQARQQQVINIFKGQIYISNLDVVEGKLWDVLEFQPGEQVGEHRQFFSRRQSNGWPRPEETNVHMYRQLDAPEAFAVQRILFVFSSNANLKDVFGVAESLVFRFWIGQKLYASSLLVALQTSRVPPAPIRECTYCHALYVQDERCPGCGAQEFRLSGLSQEHAGLQFFFEPFGSLVIANQMQFYVDFSGSPWEVESPFKLWCYLEGLHARRGVQ